MGKYHYLLLLFIAAVGPTSSKSNVFEGHCTKQDEKVEGFLLRNLNNIITGLKYEALELDMEKSETEIVIDKLSIAPEGPDGFRATFKDINITGVNDVVITSARSDLCETGMVKTYQFALMLFVRHIRVKALFQSPVLKNAVEGDFWGEYDHVKAKVYLRAEPYERDGKTFLKLMELKLGFSVKDIKMGVEKLHNTSLQQKTALTDFINKNAQDLLKAMKPALKHDLAEKMSILLNRILDKTPYNDFIVE